MSTAAFGIELIVVVGNGGIWTIQLSSSTTAAFELVQMSSFSTPAIELIQKPSFGTAAIRRIKLGLFSPFSYSDCPLLCCCDRRAPSPPHCFFSSSASSLPVASFSILRFILPCSLPLRPAPRRPIPSYSLHLLVVFSLFQVTPLAQCSPDVLNISLNI